jgi:hypothetical protein
MTEAKEWTNEHEQIIAKYRSTKAKPMGFKTSDKLIEYLEAIERRSK